LFECYSLLAEWLFTATAQLASKPKRFDPSTIPVQIMHNLTTQRTIWPKIIVIQIKQHINSLQHHNNRINYDLFYYHSVLHFYTVSKDLPCSKIFISLFNSAGIAALPYSKVITTPQKHLSCQLQKCYSNHDKLFNQFPEEI